MREVQLKQACDQELKVGEKSYRYYSLKALAAQGLAAVDDLPASIRILLENQLRHCDGSIIDESHVKALIGWEQTQHEAKEIMFMPVRVLMQDFTGVPAAVDLAAMRDAVAARGGDPARINPINPVNLEYLARAVWSTEQDGVHYAFPDTLVGTDSHTTMINGLAVLGWGVGGIEAESAMLGPDYSSG